MNEKMPIFEKQQDLEGELIKMLLEKGFEDSEAKELLVNWTIAQEKMAENSADYERAQMELNLKRARLYFKAGNLDLAMESYEEVAIQAWNMRDEVFYLEITEEMEKTEKMMA